MSVLTIRDLRKTFGPTVAVDSLSLDVAKRELVCLLGPSGCGKTTTLRMVAGFIEPTDGAIAIQGNDVTHVPAHKRDTGMVFQNYALFPHMTVAENVEFGLRNLGVPKAERTERVKAMLDTVELGALAARFPRQLSGGQQQRVAAARALVIRPAVLLLDEPFSNLDAQLRVRLREELKGLIRRIEMTTLFVTHDQEEALSLADRIVVMNEGRVEQIGSPREIYERPRTRFVAQFIGLCNLIDATVKASDGGTVQLETAGGLQLRAARADGVSPGARVLLAIRPEHLRIGDGANRIAGRVETASYLGATSLVRAKAGGEDLLVESHGAGLHAASGSEIILFVDPDRILVLPRT
jgi:putative spermidine/putrescine transport system ATP-binding protein